LRPEYVTLSRRVFTSSPSVADHRSVTPRVMSVPEAVPVTGRRSQFTLDSESKRDCTT